VHVYLSHVVVFVVAGVGLPILLLSLCVSICYCTYLFSLYNYIYLILYRIVIYLITLLCVLLCICMYSYLYVSLLLYASHVVSLALVSSFLDTALRSCAPSMRRNLLRYSL
jgi:hypothetical protein